MILQKIGGMLTRGLRVWPSSVGEYEQRSYRLRQAQSEEIQDLMRRSKP